MLTIYNAQPEPVIIKYNNQAVTMLADEAVSVPINQKEDYITISHNKFFNQTKNNTEKAIEKLAKSIILMIDSIYRITDVMDDGILTIKNDSCEHYSEDFGYLYFKAYSENCKCTLIGCKCVNRRQVLKMQKILCLSDSGDFPPFSTIGAIRKYRKIKKMCKEDYVLNFLMNKFLDERMI